MKNNDSFGIVSGWGRYRVTGAAPDRFLNTCAASGISLSCIECSDALHLTVRLSEKDAANAKMLALRTQCTVECIARGGIKKWRSILLLRFAPILCALLIVCGLAWSTLFIWSIRVTGNEQVPAAVILDALRECGVSEGSFWPNFSSDEIRSQLLLELPQLAWATVNIHGSEAEVIVRERVDKPEIFDAHAPTDVVADKTGFLTKLLVYNGTPAAQRGQAVLKGEMLISGTAGSTYSGERQVHAAGTAQAETYYEMTAIAPAKIGKKSSTGEKKTRWAVRIGKKRYNFSGNSSICAADCDKIVSVYQLGIAGLFSVPISLVRETYSPFDAVSQPADAALLCRAMKDALSADLHRSIGEEGAVESSFWSSAVTDGYCTVCLRARCFEQIGVDRAIEKN